MGQILFTLYVNELPSLVNNKIKLYADDTKFYGPVSCQSDAQKLQSDLDILSKWSEEWLLKFNIGKCKVMHCGNHNSRALYYMRTSNGEKKNT